MSRKGLGRGLSALIPEKKIKKTKDIENIETQKSIKDTGLTEIELSKIKPNPYQPRIEFIDEEIDELSKSIKEKGVLQPVIVRKREDFFELVVGERRYLAAKRAGLKKIPAIIKDLNDLESLEIAIIENIQRSNLTPIEEAKAYKRLMEEFNLTQQAVSEKVGKSRVAVANTLRLLNLPDDIKDFLNQGLLTMGHARALLSLDNPEKQRELANRIIAQSLSVRETERLVSLRLEKTTSLKKKKKSKSNLKTTASPYLQSMAEKIQEILATKVVIYESKKEGSGKIEIHFYSHEDLDRILAHLS